MRMTLIFITLLALNANANNKTLSSQCETKTKAESQAIREYMVKNQEDITKKMAINPATAFEGELTLLGNQLQNAFKDCLKKEIFVAMSFGLDSEDRQTQVLALRQLYRTIYSVTAPISARFLGIQTKDRQKYAGKKVEDAEFEDLIRAMDMLQKMSAAEVFIFLALDINDEAGNMEGFLKSSKVSDYSLLRYIQKAEKDNGKVSLTIQNSFWQK